MDEHKTEIAYWAGRLIGYDQAWEVAEEIVEAIKEAQTEVKNISVNPPVIKSFCGCKEPKYNYPEMVWCDNCGKEIPTKPQNV